MNPVSELPSDGHEATYRRSPLPTENAYDPAPQDRPIAPAPDAWLPEDEIDLREYVLVLLAWWREIALIAMGRGSVAAVACAPAAHGHAAHLRELGHGGHRPHPEQHHL